MADTSEIEIIELWRLPLDFYSLALEQQWKAMAECTVAAKLIEGKREACRMPWDQQLQAIAWFYLILGLPLTILPATIIMWVCARSLLKYWIGLLSVMAFHSLGKPYSISARRSRVGLLMARYFSFNVVLDRSDPNEKHIGTPAVDQEKLARLPGVMLACPHGVLNFGACIWVYLERWLLGLEQYTAGAAAVLRTPGLRYMINALWFVNVDRKSLIRHLRERPTDKEPHGGLVGIVPDGISGIFHSKPGTDVLHIGKKRGLMRIGLEEGVTFGAGWFAGTSDVFTIVQDPFGLMRTVSRKLGVSIFFFYGRWGLPIPHRSPSCLMTATTKLNKTESPTEDAVEAAHQQVYGALVKKFEAVKGYAGLSERTLVIT